MEISIISSNQQGEELYIPLIATNPKNELFMIVYDVDTENFYVVDLETGTMFRDGHESLQDVLDVTDLTPVKSSTLTVVI